MSKKRINNPIAHPTNRIKTKVKTKLKLHHRGKVAATMVTGAVVEAEEDPVEAVEDAQIINMQIKAMIKEMMVEEKHMLQHKKTTCRMK